MHLLKKLIIILLSTGLATACVNKSVIGYGPKDAVNPGKIDMK